MSTNFAWEEAYKRTWEIKEKKERDLHYKIETDKEHRKGIIRHFHIIIDSDEKIDSDGFLPTFRIKIIEALNIFINQYYIENPISFLSFAVVREDCEYFLVKESSDLKNLLQKMGKGFFNLERGIQFSIEKIESSKYLKEILILTQTISFSNTMHLQNVIEKSKQLNIKINIINLCAEVTLLRNITSNTNGKYFVPIDYEHFKIILLNFCKPSAVSSSVFCFLKFGFPPSVNEESICTCHLEMTDSGYICPACDSKYCNLPVECICGLVLVSFVNLSKSMYHHYLLEDFVYDDTNLCSVCKKESFSFCNKCRNFFCKECDEFLHEFINFCIFCD